MLKNFFSFLKEGLWTIPYNEYSRIKSWLAHGTRVLIQAFRGFYEDECFLRASALTYLTLLSIVPLLAVTFGVAKGFGVEKEFEKELYALFSDYPGIVDYLITFTYSLLKQIESNVVAGIGILILLAIVMMLFSNIESTFNTIWKISNSRTFLRKCGDYLALMILTPFIFLTASSTTVLVFNTAVEQASRYPTIDPLKPILSFTYSLIPFFLVWLLFSLVYIVMPNTRVPWKYAISAGIIAGSSYQVLQWIYFHFQLIILERYGQVYGAFAAVPIFLLWVEASWIILLIGAEIAYHAENEAYHFSRFTDKPRRYCQRRVVETFIAWRYIRAFTDGEPPISSTEISSELGIPLAKTQQLLRKLTDINLLTEVKHKGKIASFQPSTNTEWLSIKTVSDALNRTGHEQISVTYSEHLEKVIEKLREFDDTSIQLKENGLLKNI